MIKDILERCKSILLLKVDNIGRIYQYFVIDANFNSLIMLSTLDATACIMSMSRVLLKRLFFLWKQFTMIFAIFIYATHIFILL
ncbi:hypothetical protein NQ315_016662 [Exocentrus adspersus]|uniref:Uncharacterized protein n=1 Tax=Exocentrus adspersus TaxID=1586481 RepID=A0AAV8VPN1_9CUCU|nr:hypothetical protein NQ315_016662 [Exocentrus adspersus]